VRHYSSIREYYKDLRRRGLYTRSYQMLVKYIRELEEVLEEEAGEK